MLMYTAVQLFLIITVPFTQSLIRLSICVFLKQWAKSGWSALIKNMKRCSTVFFHIILTTYSPVTVNKEAARMEEINAVKLGGLTALVLWFSHKIRVNDF